MTTFRASILAALLFLAVQPIDAQLIAELRKATANASLGADGIAGIAVHDANTGQLLFASNGEVPLAPASNQKLLASAAAVIILGPNYSFTTELIPAADGTLVLRGSGDPAFGDPEVLRELDSAPTPDQALDALARAAAERIDTPTAIVVDDRVFDREIIHPDWPRDQLERWYCAPVQGVNVHANVLAFYPAPVEGGVTAAVEPEAGWVEITDRAEVITEGRNAVWIQRSDTDDAYTLRGSIKSRAQAPIEIALHQPALFAGRLIAERIARADPAADRDQLIRSVRLAEQNESLDLADQPVARWVSPLDEILYRCNHDSMNNYAEALVKAVGRAVTGEQGTWQNGNAVLRMLLAEKLGPSAVAGTIIRDGSGLSRENRITAATLSAWLAEMHQNPDVRAMYGATLPTQEGKLARRFALGAIQNRVHAKTGTINHVRCLSGYVTDPETGKSASFSILCNGLKTGQSVRAAYRLQAAIIDAIDNNMTELALPDESAPALGG